ncbi:MAG: N-acetylmuramoyl-L-alanine amidase [Clostridia bacterium]|nr:N-acetylmuramoyl-L-alanine amidase [Clostridia bacterium]
MIKIGLDAGHGLYTSGKQTPDGINEWTLNDDVCDIITDMLKGYDCEIIRTDKNEGKTDEPLSQRVNEYLKAGVSAFVSVHHNAYTGSWNSATGVEVYTDRAPTAADEKLARFIYDRLVKYTGLKGRGIKRANFYIINQNRVPAVLCEGGFMDGTADYKIITSNEGKRAYARAVAEGLIEFLNLKPKADDSGKTEVIYQVWEDVKKKWLPNVKGKTDYAGNMKNAVCCVRANLTRGNIYYKVHLKGSAKVKARWLPEVKNREDYAGNYNQPIDAVAFRTDTGKTLCYAAHEKKSGRWLPEVTGYSVSDAKNGYAGNFGKEIDAIRVYFK